MEQDPLRKLYGREYPAGTVIFREGEPGNKFYLIQSGQVRIVKNLGQPGEILLTTFADGDFFGEMALFELETRSASAVVQTAAVIYELGQRNFENFILQKPRVAYQIIQKLCQRIRKLNELASQQAQKPADPATAGPRALAAQLILLLTGACGSTERGCVVARPTLDVGKLSALYGIDLTAVGDAVAGLSCARFATDLLDGGVGNDPETLEKVREILKRTMVGVSVTDSRKKDVGR
ncbi:MAG: cyclic nucleotide-binding domain-containing protein [Candidatus Riflebacteria bacterium]|nr:cyclic nucleotide-binding domain-containing protein [Candidatus Riflebacteria bacterium]